MIKRRFDLRLLETMCHGYYDMYNTNEDGTGEYMLYADHEAARKDWEAAHAADRAAWEAKEKALRELADRWMDEMKPTTTPVIHQSLICHEHALCIRAILNTPAAGGKEQP